MSFLVRRDFSLSAVIQPTRTKVKKIGINMFVSFLKCSLFYFLDIYFHFHVFFSCFYHCCRLCISVLLACFYNSHSCCSLFTDFTTIMQMNCICHFRIKKQKTSEKKMSSLYQHERKEKKNGKYLNFPIVIFQ